MRHWLCIILGYKWKRTTYYEMVCSRCGITYAENRTRRHK